jgi:fumarylpyruvate hydrolase
MTTFIFPPRPVPSLPIKGRSERLAVGRIFCVGRNYEDHAKEMGLAVDRETPFYFLKDAGSLVQSGSTIAYPPGTTNFHYEMEMVVVLGTGAFQIDKGDVAKVIFGYACGLDMTRRDLQLSERAKQRPWDLGKNFENAAVVSEIVEATEVPQPNSGRIELRQNGVVKQSADLSQLVWSVPELIAHLSQFYHLQPGDLLMTGTPAGVGPVAPGDILDGSIAAIGSIHLRIGPSV